MGKRERASKKPARAPTRAPVVAPLFDRPTDTEVEAYGFIRDRLRELGWSVKDPSRNTGGQVWTQNQCLGNPEIKRALGQLRPENVVKLSETLLWVIEAKAARGDLKKAVKEAVEDYAGRINGAANCRFRAILATGVAGTEDGDGYVIQTRVLIGESWQAVTINGQEATGLLSPADVQALLASGNSDIRDFAPSQLLFLQAAERINESLHMGGINKNQRATVIAALLLSVIEEPPNVKTSLRVLMREINARSEAILEANGKADFAPFVKLLPPTSDTNHVKFRTALVRTIQELQNLNIRSAMNSGTDVLGQFYEVFLKYGNGAKDIGIVLTPRHITRFAAEAVSVGPHDVILDPACGTGGFLVAAFDHVRRNCTRAQLNLFKRRNLYGIEQDPAVALLAIVNMIFRGDGSNNITEGNCFGTYLQRSSDQRKSIAEFSRTAPPVGEEMVTHVLMNPPFALPGGDKEYKFVSRALSLMADGGILFSLLPMDAMFGAHDEKTWRSQLLLRQHTLLSVISLPDELFYPTALKQVVGIVVKKGVPHPHDQPVYWARISRDGHLKLKSRRLPAADMQPQRQELDQLPLVLPSLRNFIAHPAEVEVNVPLLCKTAPIDFADPVLELLPEAYIDSPPPDAEEIERAIDDLTRETAAFMIRFHKEPGLDDLATRTPFSEQPEVADDASN